MKAEILRLRNEGKTYNEIQEILGCSKSTISYHCNSESKVKSNNRTKVYRENGKCLNSVITAKRGSVIDSRDTKRISRAKSRNHIPKPITFKRSEITRKESIQWTSKDLLEKIGNNPICYLTGDNIDLNNGSSYHLDHIISRANGGNDELDNINIATKEANLAKNQLSIIDFLELCKKILIHHGYTVN